MPPTVLLADPTLRIAGLRAPTPHRVERTVRAVRVRWVLLATLLLLVVGALGYLRTLPPFATVMSGSMAPTIDTGDVVVLQRLATPAQVGDVVVIHVPDEARARYGYPDVVIHRVKAIGPDGMVTSKGDARAEADPFTVPREALTTRVVTHIPAVGRLFGFFRSPLGLIWLSSGVGLFFGRPLLERHRRGRDSRSDSLDEALQAAATAQALLAQHLAELPAQIEKALAVAVAVQAPPKPEPVVIPARPVPPTPPVPKRTPTPDLMGILSKPTRKPGRLIAASAWDAAPSKRFTRSSSPGVLCAA